MQPDRRHDLETNALADSVATFVERIRPHLRTLGLAAAAAAVGFVAWTVVESRRAAAREESWDACLAAIGSGQAAALDGVATRYPGTPAAQWARLVLADGLLDQGSQLLYSDRAQAEQQLQSAVATYAALLASSPLDFVAERATFGLAKARENLGSLAEARRGYEAVVAEHPGSAVRRFAEGRIAALDRESTRQWYDWFAQQKPVPPANADGATQPATTPAPGEPAAGAPAASGTGAGSDAPG
jgi:hypothetical protein